VTVRNVLAVLGTAAVLTAMSAVPVNASTGDPSDDCTLIWVTADSFGSDYYFGDARLQCPVVTSTSWRWELDGVEVDRASQSPLGPGEVPVFDDLEIATNPGQELCFFPQAWGNDKGKACVTT